MIRYTSLLLFALLPFVCRAAEVVFQSGDTYRLECAALGKGGIAPGAVGGQTAVLYYFSDGLDAAYMMWKIEQVGTDATGQPYFTLRHTSTGLYATYDGERNDNKRYVTLTDAPEDDASFWTFTNRGAAWSIDNVLHPEHHFHVRSSNLVGTYADDVPPVPNSQFVLYTEGGKRVTSFTPPTPSFDNQIGQILIGGKCAVYDSATKKHLAVVDAESFQADAFTTSVSYDDSHGTLSISGTTVASGSDYSFSGFSGGRSIPMVFTLNDGTRFESSLYFTELPIVELFGTFSANTSGGEVRVSDPDSEEADPIYRMKCHWRGNTSIRRAKKNYAFKIIDEEGHKQEVKFLGFRSDNNWILDAAFVDPSRVRNRISTDIWNDFHCAPYYGEQEPKARTATRGRMVEVFLNGVYDGIYCFTEKLDRKQLKLKKLETKNADGFELPEPIQHGLLYKAVEWDTTTYFGYDGLGWTNILPWEPINYNDKWGGWEVKYPDLGDEQPIEWAPLWDHTRFMYTCTDDEFRAEAADRFDLPVLRDYFLLQELALALDNTAKNIYWYVYDYAESSKMTLSPWDFDGTWGRIWDGSYGNSYAESTLRDYYDPRMSNNKIYSLLMRLNVDGWNEQLARRYAELRADTFHPDRLYQRFVKYFDLLRRSGATGREYDRWNGNSGFTLDWDSELPFIRHWIDTHVATLDAFYHYDPKVTGLDATYTADGGNQSIPVYALDGRRVLTIHAQDGRSFESALQSLPSGVYVVGGKKIKI